MHWILGDREYWRQPWCVHTVTFGKRTVNRWGQENRDRNYQHTIRVVITVAHLNHIAGDDRDENLAALCQWCHLIHDLSHHQRTRATRKDAARPLLVS